MTETTEIKSLNDLEIASISGGLTTAQKVAWAIMPLCPVFTIPLAIGILRGSTC